MKCYYHPEIDAIAICKNCGRALCAESITEVGNGIACKNRCESDVEALNIMFQQSKKAFEIYRSAYIASAIFMGLMGIAFVVTSFILTPRLMGFLCFTGVLMIVGGIIFYFVGRKYGTK